MTLFVKIPMRWSPLTIITLATQFGLTEWLANRILLPLRVASTTESVERATIVTAAVQIN